MTSAHAVTVVVAVHQLNRPLARAVSSALAAGRPGEVKVLVVGHGLSAGDVRGLLTGLPQDDVELLEFSDGIPSAAGPFNAGIAAAATKYVAMMGSDDMLEPGALTSWLSLAESVQADAVIAPLKMQGGSYVRTPRLRPLRHGRLDPVRDRLAYRTAPLGVLRLQTVQDLDLSLTPGVRTGEDIEFGLKLWFKGQRIFMGTPGKHYVIGEDAVQRVTGHVLPLAEEFRALDQVVEAGWLRDMGRSARHSVAIKLMRIHVMGAIARRGPDFAWEAPDRDALATAVERIRALAVDVDRSLSIAEKRLVDLAANRHLSGEGFRAALAQWPGAGYLSGIATARPWDNFRTESLLRYYAGLKVAALTGQIPPAAA